MNLLITAATRKEIVPALAHLEQQFDGSREGVFTSGSLTVVPLVTGIGLTATAFALGHYFALERPDLAINAGIAGSFKEQFPPGTVVHVVSEQFGDLGAEDAGGRLLDAFELGLLQRNAPPFSGTRLLNPQASEASFLPVADGLTVQKVHGHASSIEQVLEKYSCDVESMEGAAFFYACLSAQVPFLEIRAISNFVEPRDRGKWQVEEAIQNLNEVLIEILKTL